MIWTPERNAEQGRLVTKLYAASAGVHWAGELGAARDAVDDLEPVIAGTFDDVVHACDRGALTPPDYAVLALATAQASR